MSLLHLSDVSVSLGKRDVLRGVSLAVEEGEFIGLIGPNGAGKSTLLKAVLDLVPAYGHIQLSGGESSALSAAERATRVSYLPQERELHWPVSVEMVVGLGRSHTIGPLARLSSEDHALVDSAITQMDIAHLRDRPATELSGGELARVLIARTLSQNAPLLLADEPTAGLDPAHQIALMEQFAGIAKDGGAVIACLHDVALAARWCSRIVVLSTGEIVADGVPESVLNDDLFRQVYGVEAFIGTDERGLLVLPVALTDGKASKLGQTEER